MAARKKSTQHEKYMRAYTGFWLDFKCRFAFPAMFTGKFINAKKILILYLVWNIVYWSIVLVHGHSTTDLAGKIKI